MDFILNHLNQISEFYRGFRPPDSVEYKNFFFQMLEQDVARSIKHIT
jgi:hypothetical protein